MSEIKVIKVENMRDLPVFTVWCLAVKTVEEAVSWAQRKGAKELWYFENRARKFGIVAVIRANEVVQ